MKGVFTLSLLMGGLSFCFGGEALAHGVGYRRPSQPAVALEFAYSTGEPMSFREARVFSPADEKFAHQTGRTDEAGRLAFVPDVPGTWRAIVRDEEGHQATAEIAVTKAQLKGTPEPLIQAADNLPGGSELLLRAALGVSVLFNLAAAALLRRRSTNHAHQ